MKNEKFEEQDVDHWGDREEDIELEREYEDREDFYPLKGIPNYGE